MSDDDSIEKLRTHLVAEDERLVAAFNRRLELVEELKGVKARLGVDFLDPAREQWLRQHLLETSSGPLSAGGLDELVTHVLELTKREVGGS